MKIIFPNKSIANSSMMTFTDQTVMDRGIKKAVSTKCPIAPTPAEAMSCGSKNQFKPMAIKTTPSKMIGVFSILSA